MSRGREGWVARIVAEAPPLSEAQREELARLLRPHVDVWRVPKEDLHVDERGSP